MKRIIRNAILTTLLVILTTTGSWREARGDSKELAARVRQLEQAACEISQDNGFFSHTRLFCPQLLPAKRVFTTAQQYNGSLGGLAGADQKCQESAFEAFLGGTYKAWLSDSRTAARDRLTHYAGPYRLVTGALVALHWNDLVDGFLTNAIERTASGFPPPPSPTATVWTATHVDGTLHTFPPPFDGTCADWTSSSSGPARGAVGLLHFEDSNWTEASGIECATPQALYCIEQ